MSDSEDTSFQQFIPHPPDHAPPPLSHRAAVYSKELNPCEIFFSNSVIFLHSRTIYIVRTKKF